MKANRFIKYLRLTVALCLCIAMILPVLSCAETGPAEDSTQPAATVQTLPPEDTVPETDTESETQPQKKGCGAAIGTASVGIALTACAAVLKKKKED